MKSLLQYMSEDCFTFVDVTEKVWYVCKGDILVTVENIRIEFIQVLKESNEIYAHYRIANSITNNQRTYDTRHRSTGNWIEILYKENTVK